MLPTKNKFTHLKGPTRWEIAKKIWKEKSFSQKCNVISRGFLMAFFIVFSIMIIVRFVLNDFIGLLVGLSLMLLFLSIMSWLVGHMRSMIKSTGNSIYYFLLLGNNEEALKRLRLQRLQRPQQYEDVDVDDDGELEYEDDEKCDEECDEDCEEDCDECLKHNGSC